MCCLWAAAAALLCPAECRPPREISVAHELEDVGRNKALCCPFRVRKRTAELTNTTTMSYTDVSCVEPFQECAEGRGTCQQITSRLQVTDGSAVLALGYINSGCSCVERDLGASAAIIRQ